MYVFCNSQLAEPGYAQHIAFSVNYWSTQSASAGIRYSKSEDSHICGPKHIPGEDEAQKAPDKNADEDVSVVIHSQKHDYIPKSMIIYPTANCKLKMLARKAYLKMVGNS